MRLFGKRREEEQKQQVDDAALEVECEHITLIPSWDSAEDMGRSDRVSRYRCEACGSTFTLAEAERLRDTESTRLQRKLAG
jgi:transposase-like protein